ncbi:hypothetical protein METBISCDRAFT_28955 [Metschnikowia bicuspidata]|uniref:Uncharacterized protein n=1 Tax=Metschnikowia bicuspidata TaxID=27322 RepID=A0A4P9ZA11_9ASCO|nr:hypothetical protein METBISCDRAFT_28955 [Metschnikowia bicuspidata]
MKLLAALPVLLPVAHALFCEDFQLRVVNSDDSGLVCKSVDYPGYYIIDYLGGRGEFFHFGDDNMLVDSDQVSLIVSDSGEVRGAFPSEVATQGFFFDNKHLKPQSNVDFYACKLEQPRIYSLQVGYKKGCTKVELGKTRLIRRKPIRYSCERCNC